MNATAVADTPQPTATSHNGNYYRDQHGTWRYAIDNAEVPGAIEDDRGMVAAELAADRLLDTEAVAGLLHWKAATVRVYAARRRLPPPVARYAGRNGSPVWSEPIIKKWQRRRPGRGRRSQPAGGLVGAADEVRQAAGLPTSGKPQLSQRELTQIAQHLAGHTSAQHTTTPKTP